MDFDLILDEIGEFGKFQMTNYLLICLPVLYGAANSLSYVFTARSPDYRFVVFVFMKLFFIVLITMNSLNRCFVPGCDSSESARYNEDWATHSAPEFATNKFEPKNCERYAFRNNSAPRGNETCAAELFDVRTETCEQWVFDDSTRTIVNDVSDADCLWLLKLYLDSF